jgi:SAM-dependent methyltransferase
VLYAANTVGSVAGSILVAFVLVPLVGTGGACAALEILSLGLAVALAHREGDLRRFAKVLVPAAAVCGGLSVAVTIPRDVYEARLPKTVHIRELRESAASDVMVTDDDSGPRRIWLNSTWVAGTGGGHRLLGHLPALFVESPKRVLGIALGTGQTFAAVLENGPTRLDVVEIDQGVIDLSRKWFKEANGGLLDKPGVVVHHDDGRAFLRTTSDTFDIVVLEPLQAWSTGTSNLYSREFYEEAQRVLAPGGVVAQWIPFYGQSTGSTRSMVRTAAEVFPGATLWLDDHDGILILQRERGQGLSPRTFLERTRARGLGSMLAQNAVARPADFFSMLLLDPVGLSKWDRGAAVLVDDRPFLEFEAARALTSLDQYRPIVQSVVEVGAEAPRAAPGTDPMERAILREAAVVREGCLRAALCGLTDYECQAAALESALSQAPRSELLRKRYRIVIVGWADTLAVRTDPATDLVQLELLQRALRADPSFGDAALSLGVLLWRSGRQEEARAALDHASKIEATHARAVAVLAELLPPK